METICNHSKSNGISAIVDVAGVFTPSVGISTLVEGAIVRSPRFSGLSKLLRIEAQARATQEGIETVWNRCTMKESAELFVAKAGISLDWEQSAVH